MNNLKNLKIFRLSKKAVIYLSNSLRDILQRKGRRGISLETQVLVTLRFFAIGSYQRGIGNDYLISLSQPAISRAIKTVAVGITELLANEWIKFPQTEEKRAILEKKDLNKKGILKG
ncbi:PREDICTED: uncharacterized protein LOC108781881 [Cyphomyrmex costatus]|uniref:uncharacterized protein LOC108781881 n=1 Tax=Cyphomyrmex costatus TaxID=456900 RepID=UPI000852368E|nr:PREDICTED: uncharacterized protein LOC108781881 [Cyphomyrmex costatus]